MKVLLILPPVVRIKFNISGAYPLPPLGLAYIAAVLRKNKFSVEILDMPALKMEISKLHSYLEKDDYSIFGISCNIFNLKNAIEIARLIKDIKPTAKIVLGGKCNAFPPETIFKYGPYFDVIVRGEGEEAMLRICESLKSSADARLDNIAGVSFKTDSGIRNNSLPSNYVDLDLLPFPARDLLPNRFYRLHPPFGIFPPVTLLETSRGCPYKCCFCTLPQGLRERSIPGIIEEIKELISCFGIREIHFVDPTFTYNKNRVMELCNQLVEQDISIAWSCKTRVDLVTGELLRAMHDAGCYMISYGVESGSQAILDSLDKEVTLGQTKECFRMTKNSGIRTLAYVLLGAPGENDATVKDTLDLVKEIKPDFTLFGELMFDPSSFFAKQAIDKGEITINDLADFYILNKINRYGNDMSLTGISKRDIRRWSSAANRSVYLRLDYVLRRMKDLKSFQDFFNHLRGAWLLIMDKFNIIKTFRAQKT